MTTSWLYNWLDGLEVRSEEEVDAVLSGSDWTTFAAELATDWDATHGLSVPHRQTAVVAGRQMDLSAMLSCRSPSCQIGIADGLLNRAWHYFDAVVVEGLGPRRFLQELQRGGDGGADLIRRHATVLLHLRAIGAEPYLHFVEKPHAFCAEHYRLHAEEVGLPAALDDDLARAVIHQLEAGVDVEIIDLPNGGKVARYKHPWFDHYSVRLVPSGQNPPPISVWAKSTYATHCIGEIGDLTVARNHRLPLMSASDRLVEVARGGPPHLHVDEASVALELQLPIATGLSPRDLLKLRTDHHDEFVRFRTALTLAIREHAQRLANEEDPEVVAASIRREYLDPSLAEIESHLNATRRSMATKIAQNLTIAGATATVGLLATIPILLPAAVAIGGALTVPHLNKFVDENREVRLHDLYFLWRVRPEHH